MDSWLAAFYRARFGRERLSRISMGKGLNARSKCRSSSSDGLQDGAPICTRFATERVTFLGHEKARGWRAFESDIW